MLNSIECVGHPRDMGLAQGAASRDAIRAEAMRLGLSTHRSRMPSLRPLVAGRVRGAGAGREFFRHFAHQAERLEGLARSAGLPVDSVLDMHLRIRAGGEAAGLLARRATVHARTLREHERIEAGLPAAEAGAGLILERTLPAAVAGESRWLLRESRPAVGFRSVEIGLPWLVPGVAGVNEGGLAVVAGPLLWGTPGREGWPTTQLLVQECLQRFPDLSGALDWCEKRPVEGEQTLVLADASGQVATVVASGRERRIESGEGELQLESGEPSPNSGTASLAKSDREEPEGRVWIDPSARRLGVTVSGVTLEVGLDEAPDPIA